MGRKPKQYDIRQFAFFESYYATWKKLDPDDRNELITAILEYAFEGIEPTEFNSLLVEIAWENIMPNVRTSRGRSHTTSGAKEGNQNARKYYQDEDEDKDLGEDKDRIAKKPSKNNQGTIKIQSKSIIQYLNDKADSSYILDDQTEELIDHLISEGYSEQDFYKVIDKKCAEWNGTKMQTALKPSTLFGGKFQEYLNAPEPKELQDQKRDTERRTDAANRTADLEEKMQTLQEQYRNASDMEQRFKLKDQIAIVEQELDRCRRISNQ